MKNRQFFIVSVILVVVLCIGVGFAAVNTALTINGTVSISADADAFDQQVYFANPGTPSSGDARDTIAIDGADNDIVAIHCGSLTTAGQTVTFTVDVKNDGDLNVSVAHTITNSNETYFEVTTDWGASQAISANSSETITVTVKLLRTPADTINASFTINLTATGSAT